MHVPEQDPGVRVTLRDVWTEVRELADAVRGLVVVVDQVADHEQRLRRAERWLYALPLSLLVAIGSAVAAVWGQHG